MIDCAPRQMVNGYAPLQEAFARERQTLSSRVAQLEREAEKAAATMGDTASKIKKVRAGCALHTDAHSCCGCPTPAPASARSCLSSECC